MGTSQTQLQTIKNSKRKKLMKINYTDIEKIEICEFNWDLTSIILKNGSKIDIKCNDNEFCLTVEKTTDNRILWIE
jgi:hypothetical protein